ncbi:MAG: right-handed parallel beta-helix repeat-containing protein [Candidatus Dormibacteria bacterium]
MKARLGGLLALIAVVAASAQTGIAASPNVLLVGPSGYPGAQYSSIQAAVNAATPGDWILVAPGIYHEKGSNLTDRSGRHSAGVYITKPGLHLRGLNRNRVIVDGTNLPGSADGTGTLPYSDANLSSACPNTDAAQDLGPKDSSGAQLGRSGIEVYKASGVWIEDLTVCNYLETPAGSSGNEIWWNAGDGTGISQPMTVWGNYITGTSTYYKDGGTLAKYGIFTSNTAPDPVYGPSLIDNSYANNQGDSANYIGACVDCNIVLRHAHAQNSALGYSGTNGSGRVLIESGEWDHNRTGIAPNTLNNDDAPPPQTGVCPAGVAPPYPPAVNCFVIRNNNVHDNNNPDSPGSGIAATAPVGAGIELSGTEFDSIIGNTISGNGSWGIVAHDYPDSETFPAGPPASQDCTGGVGTSGGCFFPSKGSEIRNNVLSGNGTNGNPSNGDLANAAVVATSMPPNCFSGNKGPGGAAVTEDPPQLQEAPCGLTDNGPLLSELVCASGVLPSLTGVPAANCSNLPAFTYPQPDLTKCATYAPGSVATGSSPGGACIITLAATLAQAAAQGTPDGCTLAPVPPANAFCGATGNATPVPLPSTLANTGGWTSVSKRSAAPLLIGLALLAAILALARPRGFGRRRRFTR